MNLFERNAKVMVVLAVVAGSTSGILGKLITASPMAIGFYRVGLALPFFAFLVLFNHRHQWREIRKKDVFLAIIAGAMLFGHFFCWFSAVKGTTIASAITIAALHPVVVLLGTVIVLKKHVSLKAIVGIGVALIGGSIVAGFDYTLAKEYIVGDIFAVGTAVFMGIYFLIGHQVRNRVPASIYIFIVFASCFAFFGLGMLTTSTPFVGYPLTDYLLFLTMAILCQIGAHAVLNWSFAFVTSLYVSAWETFEIVSAPLLAMVVFGEFPGLHQYLGAIVVVSGLLYYNRHEGDSPKLKEKG